MLRLSTLPTFQKLQGIISLLSWQYTTLSPFTARLNLSEVMSNFDKLDVMQDLQPEAYASRRKHTIPVHVFGAGMGYYEASWKRVSCSHRPANCWWHSPSAVPAKSCWAAILHRADACAANLCQRANTVKEVAWLLSQSSMVPQACFHSS